MRSSLGARGLERNVRQDELNGVLDSESKRRRMPASLNASGVEEKAKTDE